MGQLLSTTQVAEALGAATGTVCRWARAGCPHQRVSGRGRPIRWDLEKVKQWLVSTGRAGRWDGTDDRRGGDSIAGGGAGGVGPQDLREELLAARVKKTVAQANREELVLMARRGQLLDAEEVEAGRIARVSHARSVLLGGPARLAPDLEGAAAEEIEQRLDSWVRQALAELAGG